MEAMKSALRSCRASRGDLRGVGGGDAVKRTVSAVSDGCSQGCEELFRVIDTGHRVECRCGFRVIRFRQTFDLIDIENGVPLKEWDFPVDFVASLFVGFLSRDAVR